MRSKPSACAATDDCWRSTATRIASTRSRWRMGRRWSRSSTVRSAGPTRRFSRSMRSSPNSPRKKSRSSRRRRVTTDRTLHDARRLPLRRLSALQRPRARARRSRHARMDRPLHRTHPRNRLASVRFANALRSTSRASANEPREYLLSHGFIPVDLDEAWRSVVDQALDGVRRVLRARRERAGNPAAWRLPHRQCAMERATGRISSISTTRAWDPRYRICGCCYRAIARRCSYSSPTS